MPRQKSTVRKAAKAAPTTGKKKKAAISEANNKDVPQDTNLAERRPEPYVELIQKIGSLRMWVVDGSYVRKNISKEFSNFGHHYTYAEIPDNDVHEDERGFVVFHELHERNIMEKGKDYKTAHEESSRRERYFRDHPAELQEALPAEGWECWKMRLKSSECPGV